MSKLIKRTLLFIFLMFPKIVYAADYVVCGNNKRFPFALASLVALILLLIRIIIPVILVITSIISFVKVTMSGNAVDEMGKAKKKFIRNILTAFIIFFLIPIIKTVISLSFGNDNSINSCLVCMSNPYNCEVEESTASKMCPGLIGDQSNYDENCNYVGDKKDFYDYRTGSSGVSQYTSSRGSASGSALARTAGEYTSWKQCDPRWGGNRLGPSTICSIGCYATSTSILIKMSGTTLLVDNFDPGVFVAHAGFSPGGGLMWGTWYSVAPNFKVADSPNLSGSKSQKAAQIDEWQKQGYYVMIGVRNGGHWVAVDRVVGDTVYIFDPGHNAVDLFTDYAVGGVTRAVLFKNEG